MVEAPKGALPKLPDGFAVQVFASGFEMPRTLRIAPNGDVFLSESGTGWPWYYLGDREDPALKGKRPER
ncbi:MAG TPA: hypothetical protein VFO14_21670 [Vicinamibacterales bacterium]|nr:hypothetical protein [Vicinamibacterales bacterium]